MADIAAPQAATIARGHRRTTRGGGWHAPNRRAADDEDEEETEKEDSRLGPRLKLMYEELVNRKPEIPLPSGILRIAPPGGVGDLIFFF